MIIVADTSGLFAAVVASSPVHEAAARVMEQETLVLSPLVLAELDHLSQRDLGFDEAFLVIEVLLSRVEVGRYILADLRPSDFVTAQEVRTQYRGLRLDLADAIGVVLADRYRTTSIFTLDQRDFRAIAPLTPGATAFRILPADE